VSSNGVQTATPANAATTASACTPRAGENEGQVPWVDLLFVRGISLQANSHVFIS